MKSTGIYREERQDANLLFASLELTSGEMDLHNRGLINRSHENHANKTPVGCINEYSKEPQRASFDVLYTKA